ncbi:MAG: hypothetical protein AB7S26_21800 [Sandaracinaceae bacterium]
MSIADLHAAHDAVRHVLDSLGLRTYLIGIVETDDAWTVEVELPSAGAWHLERFETPPGELSRAVADPSAQRRLADAWRARLCGRDAA